MIMLVLYSYTNIARSEFSAVVAGSSSLRSTFVEERTGNDQPNTAAASLLLAVVVTFMPGKEIIVQSSRVHLHSD